MCFIRYTMAILFGSLIFSSTVNALNILFLVGKFPYANQMYIINQITGLIDRGHTVTVLSQKRTTEEYCDALTPYAHALRVHYNQLPHDQKNFDVLLCQMADLGEWLLRLKADGLTGKTVIFCRGWDVSSVLMQDPHRYDTLFRQTDLWLPVCDYFRRRLISLGYASDKITVLGSSVDCAQFKRKLHTTKQHEALRLVTVARMVPQKGIDDALQALSYLCKQYHNIEYIFIGDGILKSKLQERARRLGVEPFVQFVGQQTHDQIVDWLQDADIYIQPSKTSALQAQEGIPNALKEAMAMELPVVSTYHAGIPELIEQGVSGLLVQEKNARAISEAITYLIEHKKERVDLGRAARKKVMQFYDIDLINDQLDALLISLCKE